MFDFMNPSLAALAPEDQMLIRALGGEAIKYRTLDQLGDAAVKYISGGYDRDKLDTESQRLNIMLKRKQLGLTMNDDEYERMNNLSLPEAGALSAAGLATLSKLKPKIAEKAASDSILKTTERFVKDLGSSPTGGHGAQSSLEATLAAMTGSLTNERPAAAKSAIRSVISAITRRRIG